MKASFARKALGALPMALPLLMLGCSDQLGVGRAGKLSVTPREVVFRGATPRESPYEQVVTLRNIGTDNLRVDLGFSGDAQFQPTWSENQLSLRPQQRVDLVVQFYSVDTLSRSAELRVQSNDPQNDKLTVPISNEDISPRIVITDCVRPAPGQSCTPPFDDLVVDFGTVRAGQCKTGEITIDNIGAAPLRVEAPSFQAGSSGEISFDGAAPGALVVNPIDENGIGDRKTISVKYCPSQSTGARATLLFRSNDPAKPEVFVELRGGALTNNPPVCVCNPSTMEVAPLDTITLSGAGCTDPDGQPLQFAWEARARPSGSTAPIRNANSRDASFFVDLATPNTEPYVFRVTATDTWGASAFCEITVIAVPRDALHVQLVWDTDGNDVDLHLLNPAGSASPTSSNGWFSLVNDCHYRNCGGTGGLEWGQAGNTQDNPRLDIDDISGFGPENINIARPQSGTYTVGVHYYCANSVGTTRATVRVYCNGQEAFESMKPLPTTGFFWDVASIQWPGCVINELNQTRTVSQGCTGGGFTFP
jgi:hypothetical protein